MCTVTYLPLNDGDYCLTQNRDEAPHRAAFKINSRDIGGEKVYYPEDTGANGSWIAMSDHGRVTCVLNGALKKHTRNPPYRKSRGLILLDQFEYRKLDDFVQGVDLYNIEPFTMLMIDTAQLVTLIWDGIQKQVFKVDPNVPHLWASSTLYDEYWKERRQTWFDTWLSEEKASAPSMLKFHRVAGDGDPENDIIMNRNNKVCTTSITQIYKRPKDVEMLFIDLNSAIKLNQKVKTS